MRIRLKTGFFLLVVFAAAAASADDDTFEPVDLPPELAELLDGIPAEKIDFLRGEDALYFAERHDILFARFRNKSADQV